LPSKKTIDRNLHQINRLSTLGVMNVHIFTNNKHAVP